VYSEAKAWLMLKEWTVIQSGLKSTSGLSNIQRFTFYGYHHWLYKCDSGKLAVALVDESQCKISSRITASTHQRVTSIFHIHSWKLLYLTVTQIPWSLILPEFSFAYFEPSAFSFYLCFPPTPFRGLGDWWQKS